LGRAFDAAKPSAEAVPAPPLEARSSAVPASPSGLSPPKSDAGAVSVPDAPPDPSPSASEATVPLTASEVAKAFDFTRRLLTRPEVRTFIKKAFKDELTLPKEEQERYGLPDHIKEMSESQLMLLLAYNKRDWPLIEQYLTEVEKHKGPAPKKVHDKWEAA